jgi:hypothetical protein
MIGGGGEGGVLLRFVRRMVEEEEDRYMLPESYDTKKYCEISSYDKTQFLFIPSVFHPLLSTSAEQGATRYTT